MAEAETTIGRYRDSLETRLTRLETQHQSLIADIKDIKNTQRWMLGSIFGLNTTIIGILTKGFGLFLGTQ